MKKTTIFCAVLCGAILLSSCTINKPKEDPRKITVTGKGIINVDQTSLTFSVLTKDYDQAPAEEKNAAQISKIQSLLKEAGIDSKDVSVTGKEVVSEKVNGGPWVKNNEGVWVQKDTMYSVSNSVRVLVQDVSRTKSVRDVITSQKLENTTLSNVQYTSGDYNAALRQARTIAIQNAQDAANLLAGASGNKTDNVLEIIEEKIESKDVNPKNLVAETLPGAISVLTEGTASVSTTVQVTYTLIN